MGRFFIVEDGVVEGQLTEKARALAVELDKDRPTDLSVAITVLLACHFNLA